MSLGIIFKGAEGIVLAVDSRITITAVGQNEQGEQIALPATFDNASKLLRVSSPTQTHVGAVTFGLGVIGADQPRTAHSYLPEFEQALPEGRLSVQCFAKHLSDFYLSQIKKHMPGHNGPDMTFLVAGFDEGEPYGSVYQVDLPSHPDPLEQQASNFGLTWGGQGSFVQRLLNGVDDQLLSMLKNRFKLDEKQTRELYNELRANLGTRIPYQFLPLQDCVDLCTMLIRTTMDLQQWVVDIRGVGGLVDVATITRTDGFRPVQMKRITGDHNQ